MGEKLTSIARWLCPVLAEKADAYERLIGRMGHDYWWLGEFPDASDTIRHYLDSEHNRRRAIGEPARGALPDDIGDFREHLRRRAKPPGLAALSEKEGGDGRLA